MYDVNDDGTVAGRKAVMGALQLYLDFINLFLFMLRFSATAAKRWTKNYNRPGQKPGRSFLIAHAAFSRFAPPPPPISPPLPDLRPCRQHGTASFELERLTRPK